MNAEVDSSPDPEARTARPERRRPGPHDARLVRLECWVAFAIGLAIPGYLAYVGGAAGPIDRHRTAFVLAIVLALALLLGLLPRARQRVGIRGLTLAGGTLAAWIALGLLWTDSVERSLAGLAELAGYGALAVLVLAGVSSRSWRHAAAGLTTALAVVCGLAFASRILPDLADWGTRAGIGLERLNYPLEYWNALAFLATATAILLLAWGTWGRDRLLRSVALAGVPIAGATLFLTYSRGGIIAAAAGIATLVAIAPQRARLLEGVAVGLVGTMATVVAIRTQPQIADGTGGEGAVVVVIVALLAAAAAAWLGVRPRDRSPTGPWAGPRLALLAGSAAVLLAGLAIALNPDSSQPPAPPGPATVRALPPDDPAGRLFEADSSRWQLWAAALDATRDAPLTGHGAGTFAFSWERSGRGDELVLNSHSLYLDGLAELGLPGTLTLVAMLVLLGAAARRSQRTIESASGRGLLAGLLAVYVAFLLHAGVDWLWETPAAGAPGLGAALVAISASARPRPARLPRGWGAAALVALAVAMAVVQVPGLVTAERLLASRTALALGDGERAAALAGEAIEAAPWSASARAERAGVELRRGRFAEARADALDAARLEPENWRHHMLLAQIELAAGERERALFELDAVVERLPLAGPFLEGLRPAVRRGETEALAGLG